MSMIMDGFRKHTKTVIWIVTIAFVATIVLVWGMDITGVGSKYGRQKRDIGKVNGERISAVNYFRALEQAISQETERAGGEHPSDETIEYLQNQTWDNLVGRILLEQEIKKRKIKVSDAEVAYYLKNNPPEWLKNQQIFQKDGKFDKNLYDQALQNPSFVNSSDWLQVESAIRSSLPFEKLQREIEASVRVTDLEVREDFINRNEKAKVKYIFINPNDFYNEKVEIKEEDMKKYYNEHQKDFNRDEQRRIKFVKLEKKPSRADTLAVKTRIEHLLERAKKGEIFDTLAVHYSEDPGSGKNGGDLGFFGKGQMVKPFEEAAFALKKPGDLSAPVLSQFGWHIIKLEERKKEKVGDKEEEKIRAKHILLKITMSDSTLTQLENKLNDFIAELNKANSSLPNNDDPATIQKKKNNFDEVSKRLGLSVIESDYFFKRGGYVPFLGRMPEVVDFTFRNDIGAYSDIIDDEQNMCVVMVSDIKAGGIQPFNEVRTQIESILRQNKWKEKAKEKALRIADVITKGNLSLEQVAERDTTLKVKETNLFSRNEYVPNAGRNNAFTGAAFGLPIGATSGMLETDAGFFFLRVEQRTEINESDFEAQKENIRNQLLEKKKNSVFNNWFNALKENSKIEDNRDFFLNREGSKS